MEGNQYYYKLEKRIATWQQRH